ncbi:MAG: erythronate-4-phosphate dehydrogenase, partial [Planctomycetes bacterium]|nr:erythronate-4-phosphate dehydrogenase [Planctomycetota bacterium]
MRIAVDDSIPGAVEVFGRLGDVRLFSGRSINSAHLAETDALVIRSVTSVTAELLKNTPVRFVGTATSGTDHVDILHLQKCGIQFADAAGCNARAVAEYLIAAIVRMAARENGRISGKTIGIVGCGRIGSM